jgi:hypothetical protein
VIEIFAIGNAVEFEEVGAFEVAEVGAAAAFVDAQEWLQCFQAACREWSSFGKTLPVQAPSTSLHVQLRINLLKTPVLR